jgi:outer membrane protein
MRRLLVLFTFLAVQMSVAAQDSLTLEQAIAAALKSNYDILLTRNDSTSYAIDNSYSYAGFLPQLNGTAGTTWNSNNQQLKFTKRAAGGGDSAVTRDAVKSHGLN